MPNINDVLWIAADNNLAPSSLEILNSATLMCILLYTERNLKIFVFLFLEIFPDSKKLKMTIGSLIARVGFYR